MNYGLILYVLVAIPVAGILDYFAFRGRFDTPIKWYYFMLPCVLEVSFFIVGYLMGYYEVRP